jgi:hypothetical protein
MAVWGVQPTRPAPTACAAQLISTRCAGNDACGTYTKNTPHIQAEHYKQMYRQWAFGFMSGHYWANPKRQSTTDQLKHGAGKEPAAYVCFDSSVS